MNGWGGSERINAYIEWAAERIEADYGIKLKYVKSKDVTSIVSRILAEKPLVVMNGSVDIIWLNGDNFRMKIITCCTVHLCMNCLLSNGRY